MSEPTSAERYMNREIDEKFADIQESLFRIETQTTKTNGRVTKLEKIILIVGTAVVVLLIANGSEFTSFFKAVLI